MPSESNSWKSIKVIFWFSRQETARSPAGIQNVPIFPFWRGNRKTRVISEPLRNLSTKTGISNHFLP